MNSLPVFVRATGRPVILLGEGEAADAKRRLLERAGAVIAGEDAHAALAIVAIEDDEAALAAIARLKARGILVNAVDRPELCDFTLPAIIDRDPVLIAIGTGGVSAGLAAALRQRLEALIPAQIGALATALQQARAALRARFPDGAARRRALGRALGEGGALDPLRAGPEAVAGWLEGSGEIADLLVRVTPRTADPDDLTLREARALAFADRIYHHVDVPPALMERARADAARIPCAVSPVSPGPGLSIYMEMA